MSQLFKKDLVLASAAFIVLCKLLKNKKRTVKSVTNEPNQETVKKKPRKVLRPYRRLGLQNESNEPAPDIIVDLNVDIPLVCDNFSRMSASDFEKLIEMIGPKINKMDTRFRDAIPVKDRLGVTLRFLSTGDSYRKLGEVFNISKQIISRIIREVCKALIEALDDWVKMPSTPEDWVNIATKFEHVWELPHCLGTLDGREIFLQSFSKSESHLSIILIGVFDANYNFIYVDVGCQDVTPNKKVFQNTSFFERLKNKTLALPKPAILPEIDKEAPYFFIAGDCFPSMENLMKSCPDSQLNHRLNRGKRVAENTFGLLSTVFNVLTQPILLQADTAQYVVLACVYLHNFLRSSESSVNLYSPKGTFDEEEEKGAWRFNARETLHFVPLPETEQDFDGKAEEIRQTFVEYFASRFPEQTYE